MIVKTLQISLRYIRIIPRSFKKEWGVSLSSHYMMYFSFRIFFFFCSFHVSSAVDHKKKKIIIIFWPKEFVSRNTDTNVHIKHTTYCKNNDPSLKIIIFYSCRIQNSINSGFMLSCSQTKKQQEVKTHGLTLIQRAGAEKKKKLPPLCERNLTS